MRAKAKSYALEEVFPDLADPKTKAAAVARGRKLVELEKNSTVDRKNRRQDLRCPICPPNKGENAKRHATHGARKPRKKDHR